MKHDELQEAAPEIIARDNYPPKDKGHFGPSQISGCPLKVFLDDMLDIKTEVNSWLFQGTAVHYYLQETDILTEALHKAGYHWVNTEYEVTETHEVNDDVTIHGSADVLTSDGEDDVVYDIKYSSLPADSGHGRIYKYFSQANTYAHMLDADGYGLIMIQSNTSDPLKENIAVLKGEMSEDNWEIVKQKAVSIFEALEAADYHNGNRFDQEQLEDVGEDYWKEVLDHFDTQQIPSYDKECRHCDHKEYCPVKNGMLGGLNNLIDDKT